MSINALAHRLSFRAVRVSQSSLSRALSANRSAVSRLTYSRLKTAPALFMSHEEIAHGGFQRWHRLLNAALHPPERPRWFPFSYADMQVRDATPGEIARFEQARRGRGVVRLDKPGAVRVPIEQRGIDDVFEFAIKALPLAPDVSTVVVTGSEPDGSPRVELRVMKASTRRRLHKSSRRTTGR